jgi:predicted nucleotidyltransferase component of viral defense system
MRQEDFKLYVDKAIADADMVALRPVVEKELLHYEIFNALDEEDLLKNLVFQGGTSLRLCRGAERFSEDLDFAGGKDFSAESMKKVKNCLIKHIGERFGLEVTVREPKLIPNVALVKVTKWMVSIETNPGTPDIPRQKIKIDIANVPAYTREPIPLRLNYSVLEGMSSPIVITESIDEILADKLIALPASMAKLEDDKLTPTPSKIRYRDIWDIAWIVGQGADLRLDLIHNKISDYGLEHYEDLLMHAIQTVSDVATSNAFNEQMQRFLTKSAHERAFKSPGYDLYLAGEVNKLFTEIKLPNIRN